MKLENIKYKAKRIYNGEWVYGDLLHQSDGIHIYMGKGEGGRTLCPRVDPSTVCQFTGLKDYEGNEIWEGDLLTYRYFKDIYEVVWGEDVACFKIVNTRYRERTEPLGYSIRNIAWCVVGNKFDKE